MRRETLIAWLPITTLPVLVMVLTPADWPRWVFMWLLAGTVFAGCKWLTWQTAAVSSASPGRQVGYLASWPGLDAPAFLGAKQESNPSPVDWLFALTKLGFGISLIAWVYPRVPADLDLLRGWVGMVGIIFVLHFGLFHLLSLVWQTCGVPAAPIMDWPVLATSVSDFWGKRWNRAFRDLTHRFLFRPLTARFGARTALALGFLFSGIVHELVISLPAQGGWGGPTVFFLVQAAGIFIERSAVGQRLGLGRGPRGWAFTMVVLVAPIGLLFHPPFVRSIVVPFLDCITQAQG
jgi:alginate O-acetyltransferase complex protein AlgI